METLETEISLIQSEKRMLLKIARESLLYYFKTGKNIEYDEDVLPDNFMLNCGAFVSIYKGKALRGCIGKLSSELPVYKLVQELSVSAATKDRRFSNLKFGELKQIMIEISILGNLQQVNDISEIELGKHGIFIRKNGNSGTFLPQVAHSTGWNIEEFLGYCSRDKAGIGWEGWKDADIFTYTADVFREE